MAKENTLRDITLRERVRRAANDRGITVEEAARMAGIAPRTFWRRLANPGELTLYEIHRLDYFVGFTDEEKVMLVDRVIA